MEGFKISVLWLAIFVILVPSSYGVSMSRMMANDEGGLSERSEWDLSTESLQNKTVNCQFATFLGHREYQEDRIVCDLDMRIPHLDTLSLSLSLLLKITLIILGLVLLYVHIHKFQILHMKKRERVII